MSYRRWKIERILLLVAALVLCAFLSVRVTFAWLASNTSRMAIVTGEADLEVTFYRLRDFNRDGVYDYGDYANDAKNPVWSARADFKEFTTKLLNALTAAGGTETTLTAENFTRAFAALAAGEDLTPYIYTTDFTSLVEGVNMGSYVTYRARIANRSARAANAALSFGNLMRYYYNPAHMEHFAATKQIATALAGDDGYNIENYASKFLFSVEYAENSQTVSRPLWKFAQGEPVTDITVNAGGSADLDFRLAFDGKSDAAEYLGYVSDANGECYRECVRIAQSTQGVVDAVQLTADYLRAVYEAEMTYLFSSSAGGGSVAPNVNLKLDYVQIAGELIGQAVTK